MPRKPRNLSSTNMYHIICQGIDKQDIFLEEEDYKMFLNISKNLSIKYNFDIISYCLMTNHVHFAIYDRDRKISKIMQSIEIKYSRYFNYKYERTGHLFKNRFLSKSVENIYYLFRLCRYIHKNPEKAGIATTEEYEWSSYREYVYKPKYINENIVLKNFSSDKEHARKEFLEFHYKDKGEIFDLLEFESREFITDNDVIKIICEVLEIDNVHKILEKNTKIRDTEIKKLKSIKNITITQLARCIGVNRKIIERAWKE